MNRAETTPKDRFIANITRDIKQFEAETGVVVHSVQIDRVTSHQIGNMSSSFEIERVELVLA